MLYATFIVAALAGMTDASVQAAVAKHGGVCIGPFRGGDSVLQCEHIGRVAIKQIYEKGFHVVYMQDNKNTVIYMILVTEEQ